MKTHRLSVRLDSELAERLDRAAERSGRSRSEVVREALRRHLALAELKDLRGQIMPFAAERGYRTDRDITAQLDRVYAVERSDLDPALGAAQRRSLSRDDAR